MATINLMINDSMICSVAPKATDHSSPASPVSFISGLEGLNGVLKQVRDYGLNLSQFQAVLVLKANAGRGMAHSEIALEIGLGTASITCVADALVEKGLVERAFDVRDRRKSLLKMSQAGLNFLAELEQLTNWRVPANRCEQ